ncbi:uncharacterized protein NEMAJ01_2407, partial [Nematocida major]
MAYSVQSICVESGSYIYILSYVDGMFMSICTLILYRECKVLYISHFESASIVKGLSR